MGSPDVGSFLCWGFDNKEVPLRVVAPRTKQPGATGITNIEIKTFDHTANMSIALAAVIACGIDGMKKGLKLPQPTPGDPGALDEATR